MTWRDGHTRLLGLSLIVLGMVTGFVGDSFAVGASGAGAASMLAYMFLVPLGCVVVGIGWGGAYGLIMTGVSALGSAGLTVFLWEILDGGGLGSSGGCMARLPVLLELALMVGIGFVLLLVGLLMADRRPGRRRRWQHRDPYTCVRCGYSLVGLTVPRCPECGTSFYPGLLGPLELPGDPFPGGHRDGDHRCDDPSG